MNDYNDRMVVAVALRFQELVKQSRKTTEYQVILLTNDVGNQLRAKNSGVVATDLEGFVRQNSLTGHTLIDRLSVRASRIPPSQFRYRPYLAKDEVAEGLRSGRYFQGVLRARNPSSWSQCYVTIKLPGQNGDRRGITIDGPVAVNRALDGDLVAVEVILPTSMETAAAAVATSEADSTTTMMEGTDGSADAPFEQVEALLSNTSGQNVPAIVMGRVVSILRRNVKQFCGSVDPATAVSSDSEDVLGSGCLVQVVPVDRRTPRIWLHTMRLEELTGQRLAVSIDNWPVDSEMPLGHLVTVMGPIGDKDLETRILLQELGIASAKEFSTAVMACLPSGDWKISEKDLVGRRDFRSLPIASVDPPGCKDIDDALHCMRLPNGNWQVGVHIADVTYFVRPGSPLDLEAAERSTSTYLVERRLDMLPGLLTTQLCSLRGNEEHLAFSVLWEMDDNANILGVDFGRSVINSKASLTYDQAQVIIDENAPHASEMNASIIQLNNFARILRERRIEAGALTLASPEVRFKLDDEERNPTDLSLYKTKQANSMVEEWMLLANITVSKKILRHFPALAVLRRHQPPSREQFVPLMATARIAGIHLDISSSKTLADSLDLAVRPEDPSFNQLLRMLSTRCMMPAQYFCSGEVPKDQWHHYGLATAVYTHFTSPIRRYADVLVHRLLAAALGIEQLPTSLTDRTKIQEQCTHMNRKHRSAQHAQRASVSLYSVIYFRHNPVVESAYIVGLDDTSMRLFVPKYGLESQIKYFDIQQQLVGATKCEFDQAQQLVRFDDSKNTTFANLGKVQVSVRVESSQFDIGKLVISLTN